MRCLFYILFFLLYSSLWGQTDSIHFDDILPPPPPVPDQFLPINNQDPIEKCAPPLINPIEKEPEYPGGQTAMYKFLVDNIKFPEIALDNRIQGKIYVQFTIDSTGDIKNVKILKGVHSSLDKEVIRAIQMMPCWQPAQRGNEYINVTYTVPINIYLN